MLDLKSVVIEEEAKAPRMSDFKPSLTEDDKAVARALYLALKPFVQERSTMPTQLILAFLQVCMEEGLGTTDYARKADVAPTVMTRYLLDLAERNRVGEEGFGWITQERDVNDLRRHHARLTPKGLALLNQVKHAIRTALK